MDFKVLGGVRWGMAVALLLGLTACGFFQAEMEPPDHPSIAEARQRDYAEWIKLDSAFQLFQADGLDAMEHFLESDEISIRAEMLIQDLRGRELTVSDLREIYENRYLEFQDGRSAYLLSRIVPVKAERKSLLELAKKLDGKLLQARVDRLSLEPYRVGNNDVLNRLLSLLKQDPGLAEGWRLLREIAPLYDRADLACVAADLEPWSPGEDPTWAYLDQIRTCIAAGKSEEALVRINDYGLKGKEALWLQAAALAKLERAQEAWALLQSMLETWPKDAMIHFNLALLARDYLGQPELANEELKVFLQLAEDSEQSVPYFRRLQAWTWLREAESTP